MKSFLRKIVSCWGFEEQGVAQKNPRLTQYPRSHRKPPGVVADALNNEESSFPLIYSPNGERGIGEIKLKKLKSLSEKNKQWKPSLRPISEDKVVDLVTGKTTKGMMTMKKKLSVRSSMSVAPIHVHDDDGDFRQAPTFTATPAFSPTTFLF